MKKSQPSVSLIKKYDQPVPRYTSYPTVPFWNDQMNPELWRSKLTAKFNESEPDGISLYIHLPFCESLCTYCGCNKKITRNHKVEAEYLAALEKEWILYRQLMPAPSLIREIHFGGGTPTFFSPENLLKLINMLLKDSQLHPEFEFSLEGHPNNTTSEHLEVLSKAGFRRISYGVQDNNAAVQLAINRIQPLENVRRATEAAHTFGFTSVNFDLIYGLPLQTEVSIEQTIKEVIALKPDRIAFYSYAHVPWTNKGQRLFDETDLPSAEEKLRLYINGRQLLIENGYHDIGMDHFALPQDDLYKARANGTLHRNFMGYTTRKTGILLGLGISAISDLGDAFNQNAKTIQDYYSAVNNGELPVMRGYLLNQEDLAFRKYIRDISCCGMTSFNPEDLPLLEEYVFPKLEGLQDDGLIVYDRSMVKLTDCGLFFLRNVCSAFDLYLQRKNVREEKPLFSRAI